MITIHVLAGGELFQHVLNAVASFMKQDSFASLLRLTALIGIAMATIAFMKDHNPMSFAKWFVGYALVINLVLLPKTSVLIDDIAAQVPKRIDNVPTVFAFTASLITTIGYGLAQSYDALLSMPDDLHYTKTGALFGSRLIQASRDFRIINPELREEMNQYFRSCVVGDIRLNHKYSVNDLANAANIWQLISEHASPLRMTMVNSKLVSCLEASQTHGPCSLRAKLAQEIKQAYRFFGINLFGKPHHITYEQLFSTHLTSAFEYYQSLTDAASNIFLQSMMINAMGDGIANYQAFTDATAGIVNQQFSKSQVQHRWSWEIAGVKALWFLPLLHTWLTILLFGVFPIIIVLVTLPSGVKLLYGYLQFFLSLQFWPVMFAILNAGMTLYGAHQSGEYGQFTMVNINKIDELHNDISGVAGYLMLLIPFLANGLVSNLGAAFSNLATSITSHVQGSAMSMAGEAASSTFSIGQTSFYNTSANNYSANKHDSNWTHMHGMHAEQLASGVLKTATASGEKIFDVSPGMTRSAVSINASDGLSSSLNQAYEESKQASINEAAHMQTSIANASYRAVQLSKLQGHDLRLGSGVSASETAQYSQALASMTNIAQDVAHRTGVSTEDALTHLTNIGFGGHAGVRSDSALAGKILKWGTGFNAGAEAHSKFDRSSTASDRYHQGVDSNISSREAKDFNQALNYVSHFAKAHHLDSNYSEAAQLSNQLGADLRDAQTASHNSEASLAKAERIQQARNYVASHSQQINTDFNQAFPAYVASRVGDNIRDELFSQPGNTDSLHKLQALAEDFLSDKREQLLADFATHKPEVAHTYHQASQQILRQEAELGTQFNNNSTNLAAETRNLSNSTAMFTQAVQNNIEKINQYSNQGNALINQVQQEVRHDTADALESGKTNARENAIFLESWAKNIGLHDKDKGEQDE